MISIQILDLSSMRESVDDSGAIYCFTMLLLFYLIVCRQRAVKQPTLFDFCNIPNECFVASLQYLMKDDPISLPIL